MKRICFYLLVASLFALTISGKTVQAGGYVPPYHVWSQDGTVLAWETYGYGGNIYAASTDGNEFWIVAQDCSCRLIGIGILPDQTKVVWYFDNDRPDTAYSASLDGSTPHELDVALRTAWFSPDGTQVVFSRDGEIFLMNTDGSHVRQLTNNDVEDILIFNDFRSFRPDSYWSPDGSKIAFHSKRDGKLDVFVMNADGSGVRDLSNTSNDDYFGSWSPDGQMIVFEDDQYGLHMVSVTDAAVVELGSADARYRDFESWSPDSEHIVYLAANDTGCADYVVKADGTQSTQLGERVGDCTPHTNIEWSDDSQSLIQNTTWLDETGQQQSCAARMNIDGSNRSCIFDDKFSDYTPDGERMVIASGGRYGIQFWLVDPTGQLEDIVIETPSYEMALAIIETAHQQRSAALDLSNMYLSQLPPEIGGLVNLTSLNLSRNSLTSLPREIGGLVNLTSLNLSGNSLTSLPSEIGSLTNLTTLSLGDRWSGEQNNHLTRLPLEIGRLTQLTSLDVAGNQLTSLPPEIGNLVNLTELYLGSNQLSSLPPEIGSLTGLTRLSLRENDLTGLPSQIGALVQLEELDLYSNRLTAIPSEMGVLVNLTVLSISDNTLTQLLPEIGNLVNLVELSLSDNRLSELPSELGNLSQLEHLYLGNNQLTALPPELGNLEYLMSLDARENELRTLPAEMSNLGQLLYLNLSGNHITTLPPGLGSNSQFSLDLSNNQLVMLTPEILNQRHLTGLDLCNNQLPLLPPELLPPEQNTLLYVEHLKLCGNELTSLPPEIANLTSLRSLDLSDNQFTDLPIELANMPILNDLFIGGNPLPNISTEHLFPTGVIVEFVRNQR